MSQSLGRFWSLKLWVKIIWSTGAISSLQSLRIYTEISSGPGALLGCNFSKIREIPNVENITHLPYSGKVWRAECLANLLFLSVWRKKVWRMNRSAIGLSMVGINLDGFSLANRLRFAKFAKLSPRQTFPLYGISGNGLDSRIGT